jgi:hypothetical protein
MLRCVCAQSELTPDSRPKRRRARQDDDRDDGEPASEGSGEDLFDDNMMKYADNQFIRHK